MMSPAVVSAGASERDMRSRPGLPGWRTLTWPKPSSTPWSARMRLAATRSSITPASTAPPEAGSDCASAGGTGRPACVTAATANAIDLIVHAARDMALAPLPQFVMPLLCRIGRKSAKRTGLAWPRELCQPRGGAQPIGWGAGLQGCRALLIGCPRLPAVLE